MLIGICDTLENAYKVDNCPRVNLLYKRIYLITKPKLFCRVVLGLYFIYLMSNFTL